MSNEDIYGICSIIYMRGRMDSITGMIVAFLDTQVSEMDVERIIGRDLNEKAKNIIAHVSSRSYKVNIKEIT